MTKYTVKWRCHPRTKQYSGGVVEHDVTQALLELLDCVRTQEYEIILTRAAPKKRVGARS